MEFQRVVEVVKDSIREFENRAQRNPGLVLSEADFERHLSNVISRNLSSSNNDEDEYVVHNQISHYPGDDTRFICKRDSQVDILLMKDKDVQNESTLSKGFIYSGDAIPIELKYYRIGQSISSIIHDLEKSETLLSDNDNQCYFFVVALLEEENEKQRKRIEACFAPYKVKNNMSTFIICKNNNQ